LGLAGLTTIQAAEEVPESSTTVFIAAGMSLLAIMLRRGQCGQRTRLTGSPPPQLAAEGNQRRFCQRP